MHSPLKINTDRHADFIKLELTIREAYELFTEMAALVSQQEDIVSNIWRDLENANDDVKEGAGQLNKAEWYQTSARKNKIILAAVLSLLILIVILILAWEFSG